MATRSRTSEEETRDDPIEIKKYALTEVSGHGVLPSGALTGYIQLYGANNTNIGTACFARDVQSMPPPEKRPSGWVFLSYYDSQFADVVDMLRNEKPCYLVWIGPEAWITTFSEAVGEGELQAMAAAWRPKPLRAARPRKVARKPRAKRAARRK